MSARGKRLPHGTATQALDDFKVRRRFKTGAEQRIAIASLFRGGFPIERIGVLLEIAPAEAEIGLREYLLEARP